MTPAAPLPRHPALISGSVMLAAFLYSIDWTIAAVALPHMQGAFSATPDQISWVITSYIVASAVMIPTAGWLSSRFGRKRVFLWAMAGFTVASLFCGLADSLAAEVIARLIQGLCGAFIIPLSQAITLDTYPTEIAALTTVQVNGAIKKHLNPADMVLIKAGTVPGALPAAK